MESPVGFSPVPYLVLCTPRMSPCGEAWAGLFKGCPTSLRRPTFDKCNYLKSLPLPFRDADMRPTPTPRGWNLSGLEKHHQGEGTVAFNRNFLQKLNDARAFTPHLAFLKLEHPQAKLPLPPTHGGDPVACLWPWLLKLLPWLATPLRAHCHSGS